MDKRTRKTKEFCKDKNKDVIIETEYLDNEELGCGRSWVKGRIVNCSGGNCHLCSTYKEIDNSIPYSNI